MTVLEVNNIKAREPDFNDSKADAVSHSPVALPLLNLKAGRSAVLAYFENTWALTELLFSALSSSEAFFVRPYHKTRHPLIFYYAHPVCFYVNKLLVSGLIDTPVNQEFELLFETGVDEMNWDDLHEGAEDLWPSLDQVKDYRTSVYQMVRELIKTHPIFDEEIRQDQPGWSLVMAFEHERIHLETSSVLIRELPVKYVKVPENWPPYLGLQELVSPVPIAGKDYPAENQFIEIEQTTVTLGKPHDWPSFGWDNEYGTDRRQVPPFKASTYLISNGEFYQFIADGGYEKQQYWTEDSWSWRQFRNIKWPTFWVQNGPAGSHRYKLRTCFEEIEMQWSWPAIVNYFEAKAYCAWLSGQLSEKQNLTNPLRLLRESEMNALRGIDIRQSSSDPVMQAHSPCNHNLKYGSESAVDALAANELGFYDSLGNVWQWSEDSFHPLPKFEIHPYYTDFSTPCFDDEHQMILGGSFLSTGAEASIWARFHFRPHFFQHAGYRLAMSLQADHDSSSKYESDEVVNQYLLFHYGSEEEQKDKSLTVSVGHPDSSNLILKTVELMREFSAGKKSALDLGCAVGRASFELSRYFNQVKALDYSQAFIDVARNLKHKGKLPYRRRETGKFSTDLTARVAQDIKREKVDFSTGDAAALGQITTLNNQPGFDAILLSNLLCRLSDPAACLKQFIGKNPYLVEGGILVIASPNTWMRQYTAPEKYIDGIDNDATLAKLGNILTGFSLLHDEDVAFMIREHRRKYEYIISQVTVWRKDSSLN